jgi:hypothetical protein
MAWRVAESLLSLRRQIDAMAPARDKSSDGTIGDLSHQSRNSDHNPNEDGVVTALDITHDPSHGVDAPALAELLRLSEDPRIKYVISNGRIFSSKVSPWKWRPYSGANAHTKHFHVSVVGDRARYDDTSPWSIDKVATVSARPTARRCSDIVATVFGGQSDFNRSAYDNHVITDTELGVALPNRFTGVLPKVRVTNPGNGKSVVCDIVDVGPWNTHDPYWEKGERPQAETGVDLTGRRTNLAGIDLTPAAARALGIDGKGKVNWEFVGAAVEEAPVTDIPDFLRSLKGRIQELEQLVLARHPQTGDRQPPEPGVPKMPASLDDILAFVQQLAAAIEKLNAQAKSPAEQPKQPTDQLRQVTELLATIFSSAKPALGQVNGALGTTIGNLLNGKKTAIGTIGALLTSLLGAVPSGSGLGQILALVTPAAGLGPFAMPIFLAMTAWGVLGKLEKWAQGTAPPPK